MCTHTHKQSKYLEMHFMHTRNKFTKVSWFFRRDKVAACINFLLCLSLSLSVWYSRKLSIDQQWILIAFCIYSSLNVVQRIIKDKKFRTNKKGILKQVTSDSSACFSPINWNVNLPIILKISGVVIIWAFV